MDKTKDTNLQGDTRNPMEVSNKNIEPIGFFKDDSNFVFVYKKTEKLASAVYMVTNFLSDNEPLKWTVRKKVGELLSFILGFKDTHFSQADNFTNIVRGNVLEIVSFLDILSRAGHLSSMNASILKQEFSSLLSVVESSGASRDVASADLIPKGYFDVKKPDHSLGGVHVYHDTIYRNEKTDNNPTFSVPKKPSVEHITGQEAHDANRSNRQNMILGLLRKKGDLTIKDISIVIKDCSEKTIQRELITFISSGLVKRAGERRWSRYSLTQPL